MSQKCNATPDWFAYDQACEDQQMSIEPTQFFGCNPYGNAAAIEEMNASVGDSAASPKVVTYLPSDRDNEGLTILYGADGQVIGYYRGLGQSASNDAVTETNGNTPAGEYEGKFADAKTSSSEQQVFGTGEYVHINATPGGSDDADLAHAAGRYGLAYHAGRARADGTLAETYGCVRMTQGGKDDLVQNLKGQGVDKGETFPVSIKDGKKADIMKKVLDPFGFADEIAK